MIIDHIGLTVSDFQKSKAFYTGALKPLGITSVMEIESWAGFGKDGKPEFWFGTEEHPPQPIHVAFTANNREEVRKFYKAALTAGGRDNGPPGIRKDYHPNYYAAFVHDPDGHNIEAVCHKPE